MRYFDFSSYEAHADANTVPSESLRQDVFETIERTIAKLQAQVQLQFHEGLQKLYSKECQILLWKRCCGAHPKLSREQKAQICEAHIEHLHRELIDNRNKELHGISALRDYRRQQWDEILREHGE